MYFQYFCTFFSFRNVAGLLLFVCIDLFLGALSMATVLILPLCYVFFIFFFFFWLLFCSSPTFLLSFSAKCKSIILCSPLDFNNFVCKFDMYLFHRFFSPVGEKLRILELLQRILDCQLPLFGRACSSLILSSLLFILSMLLSIKLKFQL